MDFMTTSYDQLSGWTNKKLQSTSQSQTCTKKKSHDHCLVVCCPSDPIWKLQCLQPALVSRMGLILLHKNGWLHITQPMLQNLSKLNYEVLPRPPYSPNFLPTDYHFCKHLNTFFFLQGKCFHNQQEAENAFQEFAESWRTDFYAIGINKHFSLAKMCWLLMVSILINKDEFVPSYNDLKFTIWGHNYFFINLINGQLSVNSE